MSVESFSFWFFASRSDAKRDRGLKTPEDIRRIDRIPYGPDAGGIHWMCTARAGRRGSCRSS